MAAWRPLGRLEAPAKPNFSRAVIGLEQIQRAVLVLVEQIDDKLSATAKGGQIFPVLQEKCTAPYLALGVIRQQRAVAALVLDSSVAQLGQQDPAGQGDLPVHTHLPAIATTPQPVRLELSVVQEVQFNIQPLIRSLRQGAGAAQSQFGLNPV